MGDASCRANDPPGKEGIDVYVTEKLSTHHFFTKLSPDVVEKKLEEYLRSDDIEVTKREDKYELDFVLGKQAEAKTVDETLLQPEADLDDELEAAMNSLDLVQMKVRISKP